MKKIFVVLAILAIGILLAGCTTTPAPVTTPTPTPTPAPTIVIVKVVTPEPTKEVVIVIVKNTTPNATPTPAPTPQPFKTVTFTSDLTITPDIDVSIPVGGMVSWVNNDPRYPHAIQAIDVQNQKYFGGMDTYTIPYGTPLNVTFDKAGYYSYKTVFQPEMTGTVVVTA
jgi:plastocyanin